MGTDGGGGMRAPDTARLAVRRFVNDAVKLLLAAVVMSLIFHFRSVWDKAVSAMLTYDDPATDLLVASALLVAFALLLSVVTTVVAPSWRQHALKAAKLTGLD